MSRCCFVQLCVLVNVHIPLSVLGSQHCCHVQTLWCPCELRLHFRTTCLAFSFPQGAPEMGAGRLMQLLN